MADAERTSGDSTNETYKTTDNAQEGRHMTTIDATATTSGIGLIAIERNRQIEEEGRLPNTDLAYEDGVLARAGACYADQAASDLLGEDPDDLHPFWPWEPTSWKPTPDDPIRMLVKAGALLAAEIDRLQALAALPDE